MTSPATVLALESSCDETACAVVRGTEVLSSVVATQVAVHAEFGGVVPELASRHHLGAVVDVVERAKKEAGVASWSELDALAVTEGPGLVGALLVGVQVARGLAAATGLPLLGVHHMEGHLISPVLSDGDRPPRTFEPHIALLVSGGHTELVHVRALGDYAVLGRTRDDAAGEAYDKAAKLLGLPYPGGPSIDRLCAEGDATRWPFPRAMMDRPGLEFSFSGLKTAVRTHLDREGAPQSRQELADVCASFQAAVVDVLVGKSRRALKQTGLRRLHVAGGVAANSGLRAACEALAEEGVVVEAPPLRYCGDNAAMIAAAAAVRFARGERRPPTVHTSLPVDARATPG